MATELPRRGARNKKKRQTLAGSDGLDSSTRAEGPRRRSKGGGGCGGGWLRWQTDTEIHRPTPSRVSVERARLPYVRPRGLLFSRTRVERDRGASVTVKMPTRSRSRWLHILWGPVRTSFPRRPCRLTHPVSDRASGPESPSFSLRPRHGTE